MGASTIAEQIALFETKLKASEDSISEIIQKSIDEGRTLDGHETELREQHVGEAESIKKHVAVLKDQEKRQIALAKPVTAETGRAERTTEEGGGIISVRRNLPPGIPFTRFSQAMAIAKGNVMLAHEIAKERYQDTPEVSNVLKAAISMGGTRDLAAANDLRVTKTAVTAVTGTDAAVVQYQDMQDAFIELLRPKTIMGKMDKLDRVPFLTRAGRQLTGVSGSFVGEGAPKPVGKQTFDNVTVGYAKVAVIVVLSDEAVRFSTLKAEMRARDDMLKGIATYIDKRFIDPNYSGVANVSPASITNGAVRYQSAGVTLASIDNDVARALAMFSTSDIDPSSAVWVMPATVALRLSMKRNTYDELAYPGLSMQGGTWYGIPVIVSSAMVGSGSPGELQIALVTQDEVFLAEDGGIAIDMSMEASVQMNDAPSAGAQSLVSLWQNNLVGIRAEKYINWSPKRANNLGIALIENVNY